ncbi:glycosyltransferase [Microcella alkaliphila]|uniref:Glycosyl transferase family 2 n=1 Tax=Microcella alkaliphila TaxID=279828 RepID=A0A0U5BEV3_9MICO|nr:glycosyltransferase [Microcella alkaliphila]BAU33105.1 glycosyl transferase family 2 [Microcella alkaliphila]
MTGEDGVLVDVIIAVHNARRPVGRAVRSALVASARARVTVVCHNVESASIAAAIGDVAHDPRVRLIELHDGIASPSGPFNAGLDASSAQWLAIMGSDDELERGSVDAWLERAHETGADVVLPTIVRRSRVDQVVATPPARRGRDDRLDGIADRLAYRSAPLGLMRRNAIDGIRLAPGQSPGGDVIFTSRLYFSDRVITRHRGLGYIVHDDADDRVTLAPRGVAHALRFVDDLLSDRWFRAQPESVRRAIVVKTLRVNVLGQFVNRPMPEHWNDDEREELTGIVSQLDIAGPGALARLSRADRRLLDSLHPGSGVGADALVSLAKTRRRYGLPSTLLPRQLRYTFDPEAPMPMMVASWHTTRRDQRARRRLGRG